MKNKSFPPGAWHHIYSITRDGGVLFYRITDRLCFFSIISIYAHRYHMIVLGLSIMFTHFHMMVRAVDTAHIRAFVGQCLATFTRIINDDRDTVGSVFKRPFGCASRFLDKEKRSSLIYLLNNPVEKKLCSGTVDDRWTFLAFARKRFPFSARLVKRDVRHCLRNACDVIDKEQAAGRFLRPKLLRRLFQPLTRPEQEQLTDYIIQRYQFINFEEAIDAFDDYESLVTAANASAGKEFGVREEFGFSSDVPYREMCSIAAKAGLFDDWKLFKLSKAERYQWFRSLRGQTGAQDRQVMKFLHILEDCA